jgi:hypothetical protein
MRNKDNGGGEATPGSASEDTRSSGDPDVGYAKPPLASRFKPGESGNPRGRPKNRKNPLAQMKEEMIKPIRIKEGQNFRYVPSPVALIIRLRQDALKGEPRAMAEYIKLVKDMDWPPDPVVAPDDESNATERLMQLVLRAVEVRKLQKRVQKEKTKKQTRDIRTADSRAHTHSPPLGPHDGGAEQRDFVVGKLVKRAETTIKK